MTRQRTVARTPLRSAAALLALAIGLAVGLAVGFAGAGATPAAAAPAATKAAPGGRVAHRRTPKPTRGTARPVTGPASVKPAATAPAPETRHAVPGSRPSARPIVLSTQRIVGKAETPNVLFVHAAPEVSLEFAPSHPSYLRDDFTGALSSPVRIRVRAYEPLRANPVSGGSR